MIKNKKKFIIILISTVVVLGTILIALAWILKEDTVNNAAISNFITNGDIYFKQGDSRKEITEYVTGGLIKVNTFDKNAINFIGNLRFDVQQKGLSPCYLRVRLLEQWIDDKTEEIMPGDNIPYIFDGIQAPKHKWYDNRKTDLCFYYYGNSDINNNFDGLLNTYDNKKDKNKDLETIPLITGVGDYLGVDSGVTLYITFKVESIQPNRLKAFWNIEKLPWQ